VSFNVTNFGCVIIINFSNPKEYRIWTRVTGLEHAAYFGIEIIDKTRNISKLSNRFSRNFQDFCAVLNSDHAECCCEVGM